MFEVVLPDVLRSRAEDSAARPFFQIVGCPPVSYDQAYSRARSVGSGLVALDVEHGDRVLIMASQESIWLGTQLVGAVEVAINTAYRGRSLERALQNSQAKTIFIDENLLSRLSEMRDSLTYLETVVVFNPADVSGVAWPRLPGLRLLGFEDTLGHPDELPARAIGPQDTASVVYTSGTTGPAKGVVMPRGQISLFARAGVEGARMTQDDVHYCFIPLFHVAGKYMAIYGSMSTSGFVIIDTKFSAEKWLSRAREYGATLSHVHGPLVEMIYKQPENPQDADNPVTRMITSPFPAKIAPDFERRFGLRGIETWGMTEVTVPVLQPYDEKLHVGRCGRVRDEHFEVSVLDPDTDVELAPGQIGALVVRPRAAWTIMQGYLRMPEVTLRAWRNLWFHSGDLGYIDDYGYVYLVERGKERIRRRAENIPSYDIEAAALEHRNVLECAAVGVASEFEGDDDVKLYVILVPGGRCPPEDLISHLVGRLPHFMVPRYIALVDDMPRTPTGKVQKSLLRDSDASARAWDREATGRSLRDFAA